jgi:hypothetical protein
MLSLTPQAHRATAPHTWVSDPPALLLCHARAVLPQTPTPQNCTISMGQVLKAWDPQTFTISTGHASPQACTALQDLCSARPHPEDLPHRRYKQAWSLFHWAVPSRPALACTISTLQPVPIRPAKLGIQTHTMSIPLDCAPSKPVKLGILRHTGSPLRWPVPFRHAKPMLQRPATSPQLKASTCRPMGPHPPDTCHRKAPNLPKRHTQTGLDAKELASEQLRLQFYCSTTGDFFFPFFKGFAVWFTVWSSTISPIFFLFFSLLLSSFHLSLFFILLSWFC